ncbi:MAG: hypothetical protein O2967_18740 [Proteobacteria bacterium]|nr:hypothetical protein [Pseudomonadota bacterium]
MKHAKHHRGTPSNAGNPVPRQSGRGRTDQPTARIAPQAVGSDGSPAETSGGPHIAAFDQGGGETDRAADDQLLDELQALLNRLGTVAISLTLYLVEFGGLPNHLALPLLQAAAGRCALLRVPARGGHLVIFLGPEPSSHAGGFLGRLDRGLAAMAPASGLDCAWAEVRMLRRCNHDVAAPASLLLDLTAAMPRVVGISNC